MIKFNLFLLTALFLCMFSDLKAQRRDFKIFDAIMIPDKPDLTKAGLSFINMIYQETVVNVNLNKPDEMQLSHEKIRFIKKGIQPEYPICLDIESWTLNQEFYKISVPKYVNALNIFHKEFPKSEIGYFGIFPHDSYDLYKINSTTMKDDSRDWKSGWLSMNQKLIPIAKKSDFITVVAYTLNDNKEEWLYALKESVNQARKLAPNKNIYIFLWPQYFNRNENYNEDFFHSSFWYYQLEKCYELADGIILWMPPYNIRNKMRTELSWNEEDGWWIRTKEFIKTNQIQSNK